MASSHDAQQRCMICRAIGYVIAALVVGAITWALFNASPVWLAVLAFLALFGIGLIIVHRFCGPMPSLAGEMAVTGGAGMAAGAAAVSELATSDTAQAEAEAEAEAEAAARQAAEQAAAEEAAAKAAADRAAAEAAAAEAAAEAAAKEAAAAEAAKSKEANLAQAVAGVAPAGAEASAGIRPEALDGPRDGVADDLKRIKGIGPKLEKLCNTLGFYHFDQISAWSAAEVAWVDANLEGFKGRVSRDEWVDQAKTLAKGEETAFSKKVDKGGVY